MTTQIKSLKNFFPVAIAILLMSDVTPANKYTLSNGYTVSIHGTSNLHNWDETVGTVTGDGVVNWNSDGSFDLDAVNIKMGVSSIKSTEGSMMDNNTYKALKENNNPDITFVLVAPIKSIPAGGHTLTAKINLSIAGVTKAVDMTVKTTAQAHGNITFEGSKTIKMTDYGIKPPVALFGTLKTGDEITIIFKTVFVINK